MKVNEGQGRSVTGRLPVGDVCREGTFAGWGHLPGGDVFNPGYYIRMFLPGTISPGTICKVSIISSPQSWT